MNDLSDEAWLRSLLECPRSLDFVCKTPDERLRLRDSLHRWQEAGYPDLKSLQSESNPEPRTDRNTLKRKADARVRRMGARKIIQELLNTDDLPTNSAEKYGARLDARRFLKLTEGRAQ